MIKLFFDRPYQNEDKLEARWIKQQKTGGVHGSNSSVGIAHAPKHPHTGKPDKPLLILLLLITEFRIIAITFFRQTARVNDGYG